VTLNDFSALGKRSQREETLCPEEEDTINVFMNDGGGDDVYMHQDYD
jgi:hypothetical protein